MEVSEALAALREIERLCPQVRVKVLTLDDVHSRVEDLTDDDIRSDYNWQHWGDLQEWDWEWVELIGDIG